MNATVDRLAVPPSHKLGISESDAVIDSLPLGIVFQNSAGEILTANPAALSILGLSLDQMKGITSIDPRWRAVREDGSPFPGDEHPAMVSLRTGLPVKNVRMGVFNPAIADYTWIDVSSYPAKGGTAGAASGVFAVFENITALKKAEDGESASEVRLESEEKMRRRLDHLIFGSQIGTFEWNVQTGEAIFNDRWATIVGCTLDELKPWSFETWSSRIHPEDLLNAKGKLDEHFRGKTDFYSYDFRIRHKDGHWVWVYSVGCVISRTPDGKPLMMYGGMRDISERKRTEEKLRDSEERFRNLVESTTDFIWKVDKKGVYTYASPAACHLLGYEPEEMIGKTPFDFMLAEEAKRVAEIFGTLVTGHKPIVCLENTNLHKNGQQVILETSGVPFFDRDGILIGYRGIDRDITVRKNVEKEVMLAKVTADAAVRAKDAFFAMMTHELRTPLNGVMGFSELLSGTQLSEEQREYVQATTSSGAHLLDVINDILDFSSMESGKLQIYGAPFAIAGILESSMQSVRTSAHQKGLDLHSETGPGVKDHMIGDERRLRQILINLLGNAVKFTPAGSIVLRVDASTIGNQPALDFSVKDTGPGISAETLERLFQPFTQGSSAIGHTFGGTGLGLSISRRLAEAMNGTITVKSTSGKGCVFTLSLPLESPVSSPGPGPAAPVSSAPASSKGDLILVVDDDRASGVIAVKMLQNLGYQVGFATNGAEAIEVFLPGKYSSIFMDLAMPVMDGLIATRKIREIEGTTGHHVPIVAFTAQTMIGERERCLAAGMDDYLSKPVKKAELEAKLASVARVYGLVLPVVPSPSMGSRSRLSASP